MLVALVWGGAIVFLIGQAQLSRRLTDGANDQTPALIHGIALLVAWGAFTPVILSLTRRLPLDRPHVLRTLAIHLLVAAGFIFLINVGGRQLLPLLSGAPFDPSAEFRAGVLDFIRLFHLALVVYTLIAGVGYYVQSLEARRREELTAERLRADLAEARLLALRLQLQPHFLFNALNSIGSLILVNRNREAHEALGRLGDLLRGVLATESRSLVPLREERELAEAYLALEQTRLGDRLATSWEVAPDTTAALLPPMLLQLLVENAVRHGIAPKREGGHLRIRAMRTDRRLELEVWDDGGGLAVGQPGTGVGLENTRRRLAHQFGDEHRLELERIDGWTRASVTIPFLVAAAKA